MADHRAVKTAVTDLEIGMFVTALDRPWVETPFLVQGFYITSQQDVEELEKHCRYVFVDIYQSASSTTHRSSRILGTVGVTLPWQPSGSAPGTEEVQFRARSEPAGPLLFPHRKLKKYDDTSTFEQELPAARKAHSEVSLFMAGVVEACAGGGKLELAGLRETLNPMVDSIVRNPDACVWLARLKSAETYHARHSVASSIWAVALGRQFGLPLVDLQRLALGALLFDIGKIRIPLPLLLKHDRLSRGEFELLKSHVAFGLEMLQDTGVLNRSVSEMVEFHHERHGGTGYPKKLKGEEIPVFARMAAVIDCYDAITSARPYSPPLSPSNAVKKLYAWRGVDFQAEIVEEFVQTVGIYPAGTLVELSNGEVAMVLAGYRTRRLRPRLLVLLDRDKTPLAEPRPLDLHDVKTDIDGKALEIATSLEPGAHGIDPELLII